MVQTVCMPGKFAALCRNLTEEQRHIVRKIRLGGLLSIPSMPIQRMVVESLAENFNEIDRTFNLRGHVIPMSTWDMYCILGLLDKGDKIEISRKQADPTLFNLYKEKGDTAITFKYMEQRIPREADEVHFTRLFVLYAIGTILAPTSKEYVGSNYLHLVADVSKIKGLNWASFTLDHLSERLAMFKKNRRTGLAGNLAFLQVWYFEHFRATGDCFDYDLHEHPLIKNWHEAKVVKRARLEGIKKFGAEKVVIELDSNESKVHTANNNFDQRADTNDKVEKEKVNVDGLHHGNEDDKIKIKDTMESVKMLLENTNMVPEVHTIIQLLVKLADGNNKPAKCEEKQCGSANSKPGESHPNVDVESDKAIPASEKSEKEKPCQPGTAADREFSSRSRDRSNFSSGVKRKIDFITSPTLVEKVKTRKNRKPSKVLKSPYADVKPKRGSKNKTTASVDKVTEGLNLSEIEVAAITYVLEQIVVEPQKNLVCIDGRTINASQFDCLVRPVREDGDSKWLCTWIMSSYVSKLNSQWDKHTPNKKHAIAAETGQWLQEVVAQAWRETGLPYRYFRTVCEELVQADMVFIPMNTSNTHWLLCVLCPAEKEIQVLDSFNRPTHYYEQVTENLRIGIYSLLQAGKSSMDKFKSRWSNYDILNWEVVVKKNIPRQSDGCSCGIFAIKYMKYWNGSEITNTFSQNDMETFRKKMPAELILSPLNSLTSIKDHVNAMHNF